MFGFNIVKGGICPSKDGNISFGDIVCEDLMINKFSDDKVFYEDESYILILDGVILNKASLMQRRRDKERWCDVLLQLYHSKGENFFSSLRGSFAGALYDKSKSKWIIFSDQLGTKYVYYSLVGDFFSCAEMCEVLYDNLRSNHIDYNLDLENARLLLSYGYMIEDRTLCDSIKKIQPGCYIVYENGHIEEKRYYLLDNTPNESLTEQEIIDKIDNLFCQAIRREFEKDNEYGYKHIVALSGGLDSRMTSFVAHDCGYTDQLNCTFSQTNYWDESVPKEMASFMKHEWLFKALDNGLWLKDVDEVTKLTSGNVAYYTVAHGHSLIKYINFDNLGLIHTGQIGDSTISTKNKPDEKFVFGYGAYMADNIVLNNIKPKMSFKNKELGFYYYRALSGANAGIQYIYNFTESLSPFLDLDFLEFALTIPYRYRQNHYIYKKWIIQKHPSAAKFVWEKIGCKITDKTIDILGHNVPIKKIYNKFKDKYGFSKKRTDTLKNMNPYGYYLKTNQQLKPLLYKYFEHLDYIKDDQLKALLTRIKESGEPTELLLSVTLLSAVKRYYC